MRIIREHGTYGECQSVGLISYRHRRKIDQNLDGMLFVVHTFLSAPDEASTLRLFNCGLHAVRWLFRQFVAIVVVFFPASSAANPTKICANTPFPIQCFVQQ